MGIGLRRSCREGHETWEGRAGNGFLTCLQRRFVHGKLPPNIKSPNSFSLELLRRVNMGLAGLLLSVLDPDAQSDFLDLTDGTVEVVDNILFCSHLEVVNHHVKGIVLMLGQHG